MTLIIDTVEIERLFVNDKEMEEAYCDQVLVFSHEDIDPGPIGGETIRGDLTLQSISDDANYDFDLGQGDMVPKELTDTTFYTAVRWLSTGNIEIEMKDTGGLDLGKDFWWFFGAYNVFHLYAADATYSFAGGVCKWVFTGNGTPQNGTYRFVAYQKNPGDVIADYTFLPGRSQFNEYIGYTSFKYENDVIGDLDPKYFKSSDFSAILHTLATGMVTIAFENPNLPQNLWREVEFSDIGLTLYSADATFSSDSNGTYWTYPGITPDWIVGVNYNMRMRGNYDPLFSFVRIMDAAEQDGFIGFSRYGQLSMGELDIWDLKNYDVSSIMTEIDGRLAITWGNGIIDLPQNYFTFFRIQNQIGNQLILYSQDFLFNNVGDAPNIQENTWTHPSDSGGFTPTQQYYITWYCDKLTFGSSASAGEIDPDLTFLAYEDEGRIRLETKGLIVKGLPVSAIILYPDTGVFTIILDGEDKLPTYFKQFEIRELGFKLNMADCKYDNNLIKGQAMWWTYTNLPNLVPGVEYTLRFWY